MRQGEIWYADLNPTKGNEQAGLRPVVIVSGNLLNLHLNIVLVVPLTTQIKNYKGNPVLSPNSSNGLTSESEMLVFHIRSIAKEQFVRKIGQIEAVDLEQFIKTLNDILKY